MCQEGVTPVEEGVAGGEFHSFSASVVQLQVIFSFMAHYFMISL